MFSDATLSDINVVLCFVLSQYHLTIVFSSKWVNVMLPSIQLIFKTGHGRFAIH
jgi:hypothetical protein